MTVRENRGNPKLGWRIRVPPAPGKSGGLQEKKMKSDLSLYGARTISRKVVLGLKFLETTSHVHRMLLEGSEVAAFRKILFVFRCFHFFSVCFFAFSFFIQ